MIQIKITEKLHNIFIKELESVVHRASAVFYALGMRPRKKKICIEAKKLLRDYDGCSVTPGASAKQLTNTLIQFAQKKKLQFGGLVRICPIDYSGWNNNQYEPGYSIYDNHGVIFITYAVGETSAVVVEEGNNIIQNVKIIICE